MASNLQNTLKKIQTFEVRELLWCIGSPALLYHNPNKGRFQFLTQEWYDAFWQNRMDWIIELDKNPEPLIEFLKSDHKQLLGKRFEKLIHFWLKHHPRIKLLSHGAQIVEEKQTIGEVDFLFKELDSGETYHLEVACKFYLSSNNSGQWKDFIGPNGKDRLLYKMNKTNEQLDLFNRESAQQLLRDCNAARPTPILMIKGALFYHPNDIAKAKPPKWASRDYHSGWYLKVNELNLLSKEGRWIILSKKQWLTTVHDNQGHIILSTQELIEFMKLHFHNNKYAISVAQVIDLGDGYDEISRGFVVHASWPESRN